MDTLTLLAVIGFALGLAGAGTGVALLMRGRRRGIQLRDL